MSCLYAMPGNEAFADRLVRHTGLPRRELRVHRFPDGESLVRVELPPAHEDVALVCTLDNPDGKVVPLLMTAATLRELGAARVGLVAPYLAYMRQDTRFHPGEAVSARIFGRLLGGAFDWLVTVDPHLHRYHTLDQAWPLDGRVVHAAAQVAAWIGAHVDAPLIVGPDGESDQWVRDVATRLGAPFVVARKARHGDRDVDVTLADTAPWKGRTPVLVDDIISSGRTMVGALQCLGPAGSRAPVCIGVHGIFAPDALAQLAAAGAGRIVTCNTIDNATALIDISADVAATVAELARAPHHESRGGNLP
ncbi:MAG: ribose-phosphate diphosphokinase [Pseudomonadota bacterium]|nr:ribose-phosphate diphosphokinase [Pseudomonadota bacterium]